MTNIFLETGSANNEYIFIKSLVSFFCGKNLNVDYRIITVGGKDNLHNYKNQFLDHENTSEKNMIIFDADFPLSDKNDNGGFQKRSSFLKSKLASFSTDNPTELFLFPNNHDDGAFENLLENIVQPEHKCIIDFFKEYEENLSSCKDEDGNCKYNCPDQKARVYAYASAVKKRTQKEYDAFKKGDWSFTDEQYWNLNSDYLKPLKNFLQAAFS